MVSAAKVSDIGAGDEQEKKKEERGTCFNGSCVSKSVIGGRVSRAKRNNHKRLRVKESERKRPVNDNTARHHGKRTEKRGRVSGATREGRVTMTTSNQYPFSHLHPVSKLLPTRNTRQDSRQFRSSGISPSFQSNLHTS
jgi:hypothetical protein